MNRKASKSFKTCLVIFYFSLSLVIVQSNTLSAANFSLSVSPYEGGYNLKFGKISLASGRINKEVTIRIESDIARQYQLVQTFIEPLTTPDGNSLAHNCFFVYGIRGSNKYGTLNVEQEVPVGLSRQVIYTSNSTGESDSFTLVYGLIIPENVQAGSYRGRMGFTLEPLDSSLSPVTVILNVFAEVEVESGFEIRTVSGSKVIMLKPEKDQAEHSDVIINFKGVLGKQFRILQSVNEQLVSSEGQLLDAEALNFIGKDAQRGIVINQLTKLILRPQIIYTSSPRGENDSFVVSYVLGDLSKQAFGLYRTKINYIFEGLDLSQARLLDILDLEVEIPRIFDLAVFPESGGIISFRDLRPTQPPKVQEVTFEVKTNIGKQYQVTQNMSSLLTTKEGQVIPAGNFTLRQEGLNTKGTLKNPEKVEVSQGQMVLFISDKEGSPDKFKVIYELTVPRDIHYGNYNTNFTYTVSEI